MSQVVQKFIANNAINGAKFRLDNNQTARARNAANSADIDLFKITNLDVFQILRTLDLGGNQAKNAADPTDPQDLVTKQFAEALFAGVSDPKDPVKVATTGALPGNTYANGASGVGATLTANASGAFPTVDGVGLSLNDRILVKDEVATLGNGIYTLTQVGDPSTPWILTRSADANSADQVSYGMFTNVVSGLTNSHQAFYLATANPIVIGTTGLTFLKLFEVIIAGAGLDKVGSTLSVELGAGLTFSSNAIIAKLDSTILSLATLKVNGSGEIVGLKPFKSVVTLSSTDITNQYVDLANVASQGSIDVVPVGGPPQREGADYGLSYTGGTSSKTRVSFTGDLASGGNAALVVGDILEVKFQSLDY